MTHTPSWADVRLHAQDALQALDAFVAAQHVQDLVRADHLGFKCATTKEFEAMRTLLENESAYLYQSVISQRRIAIFKLIEPLVTACGPVQYIELSDQKPDLSQVSGFDHVEAYPTDRDVPRIITMLQTRGVAIAQSHRPHHVTFDTRLTERFMLRIEQEPLMNKIKHTELA